MDRELVFSYMKRKLRLLLATAYYTTGKYKNIHKGSLIILMYHRVLPESYLKKNLILPGMYVEEKVFERQINYLSRNYKVISFEEFFVRYEKKDWDESNQYCIITFDDGWRDNYEYAFPILKEYNMPATIFLTTSFIDSNQWFWPERLSFLLLQYKNLDDFQKVDDILKNLLGNSEVKIQSLYNNRQKIQAFDNLVEEFKKYPSDLISNFIREAEKVIQASPPDDRLLLTWKEIEEMSADRISFGSHGCTHQILTSISPGEMLSEINDSQKVLAGKKINYVPVFCYPNGNFDSNVIAAVIDAGYQMALTTRFGYISLSLSQRNFFDLKRIGIHNDITGTESLFSFHLSGLSRKEKASGTE